MVNLLSELWIGVYETDNEVDIVVRCGLIRDDFAAIDALVCDNVASFSSNRDRFWLHKPLTLTLSVARNYFIDVERIKAF